MSTLAQMFGRGVAGSRPAAGIAGRHYYSTDTQVLERDNGSTWDSVGPRPPFLGCRAYKAADQTGIADSTRTAIVLDTERYDTGTFHDAVTNNTRFTAPVTGYYAMGCNVQWDSNTTGARFLIIVKDGTTDLARVQAGSATGFMEQSVSTAYLLSATNYVEFQLYQTSGGNRSVVAAADFSPAAWIHLLGL